MANRRKFIAGLGALATGSAAAMGTGAFTSVSADRQVDVQVAEDANAFLGLDNSSDPNDAYFDTGSDEYAVNFNDSGNSGSGVNPNANTVAKEVFKITNQGTQSVEVSLEANNSDDLEVQSPGSISAPGSDGVRAALSTAVDQLNSGSNTDSDGAVQLDPGQSVDVDFAINSGTSDLSGSLTISGDATTTNADQ
ncbi:hypothetical protein [Halorubrum halophilum]|uniref:hypothetical protein n=1 Tax=Halorubrum halophilum TaxID=413816 RepID=UPI0006789B83|nr:hypothetical protein [Halorubrum halophilum]